MQVVPIFFFYVSNAFHMPERLSYSLACFQMPQMKKYETVRECSRCWKMSKPKVVLCSLDFKRVILLSMLLHVCNFSYAAGACLQIGEPSSLG